jgi:MFS family permease
MKKIAFLVAAASLFAFTPFAARFGPTVSSIALVWLGVVLALVASGASGAQAWLLAIGTGALGAFASGVLGSVSAAAAGAVLVAAAFVERSTRVRGRTARAVHVLLAVVGGALAGSLGAAYTTASTPVFVVATIVAAFLAALPLLVEADDPMAHALDQAAELVSEPAKKALHDGAELRRTAEEVPLDRATRARVTTTWQSLLRLAEARVRLEKSRPQALLRIADIAEPSGSPSDAVLAMVDQKISEHVSVLARAFAALDTARAARIGIDDAALRNVESMGESLEDVSRALVEVRVDEGSTLSKGRAT